MEKEAVITLIRELVGKMGMTIDNLLVSDIAGHTLFTITTKDSGALIGTGGETLHALNHLVKKILEDEGGENMFHFVIDVNGYHATHIRALESQALMLAERARTFKYDIEMSPMSSYDRLIVHSVLQGSPDVLTESQGEGKVRHIVIKYTGDNQIASGAQGSVL
ncbi:MAG TPA: R3H domain-containing nucleic acid-binding protein [Candidatus Paceibacterota bacterium]